MIRAQFLVSILLLTARVAFGSGSEQSYYSFGEIPDRLPNSKPLPLSLQEAIQLALEANYDIQIEAFALDVSKANELQSRANFEPTFSGNLRQEETTTGSLQTDSESGSVSIRKKLFTGTEFSAGANYRDADSATNGTAFASAQLTQPLLRGVGIKVTRAPLVTARRNLESSKLSLHQQMIDTVSEVENTYWSLVSSMERLKVQRQSLASAVELEKLTRQRADAGIMSESDSVEAGASVYARETDVVRAEESVRRVEDSLKESLAMLENPAFWVRSIQPITEPSFIDEEQSFLTTLRTALENRPDYQSEMLRLRNADLALYVAKNNLLPKLDLIARGQRNDSGDGFGSAIDAYSNDEDETWSVLLQLEVPLGNKAARARRDRARAEKEQRLLRLKKLEIQIIRETRRALDAAQTAAKVLDTTSRTVELEELKLTNEQIKLELGKSTTDIVVRFIQSLNGAQLSRVQALIDYNRALVTLARVQGTTLSRHNITLDEEME